MTFKTDVESKDNIKTRSNWTFLSHNFLFSNNLKAYYYLFLEYNTEIKYKHEAQNVLYRDKNDRSINQSKICT